MNIQDKVEHVFVLMLENRSFDHMLGFSEISGTDLATGDTTSIVGLTGEEVNSHDGMNYRVLKPARQSTPVDPGHEFIDAVQQFTGETEYNPGVTFNEIDNSGYVANYAATTERLEAGQGELGAIMECFAPEQIPVLGTLAKEFAVCDHWYSSMPGPTWPNRFFAMAATAGGLDDHPDTSWIIEWSTVNGIKFENGHIFSRIEEKFGDSSAWKIYADSPSLLPDTPIAGALDGINMLTEVTNFSSFAEDLQDPDYKPKFTWIEPNYGNPITGDYASGNSQHPLDGITNGEQLVKDVYKAIRNSPLWEKSMLIVTYDEHGGFYDHVAPPAVISPNDEDVPGINKYGFEFKQLGTRVPAIVISPYVEKNLISHETFEHSSIPATVGEIFGMPPLTDRDKEANDVCSLLNLDAPRTDCPTDLPEPVAVESAVAARVLPDVSDKPIHGNAAGQLYLTAKQRMEATPEDQRDALMEELKNIKTCGEALDFCRQTESRVQAYKRSLK